MNEVWKHIENYENEYMISNFGRVKSIKFNKEKIIQPGNCKGYNFVGLYKNNKVKYLRVHRLVLFSFNQEDFFEGADVNHKDGNKLNNNLDNLEWCTKSQNTKHAYKNKLMKSGDNHHFSKLNKKIIRIIRLCYKNKYFKQNELSKIFNVSCSQISLIVNNKSWT